MSSLLVSVYYRRSHSLYCEDLGPFLGIIALGLSSKPQRGRRIQNVTKRIRYVTTGRVECGVFDDGETMLDSGSALAGREKR